MKNTSVKGVIALAAGALLVPASMSVAKIGDANPTQSFRPDSMSGQSIFRSTNYSEGFEAMTVGAAPAGWGTIGAPIVNNTNPSSGSNHLQFVNSGAPGFPGNAAFSPNLGPQTLKPYKIQWDTMITNSGGADYDIFLQDPNTGSGLATLRVKHSYTDGDGSGLPDLLVVDGTGGFVTIGDWTPGVYQTTNVQIDLLGNMSITHPGIVGGVYNTTVIAGSGGTVSEWVAVDDNFHLQGESGNFDNVLITKVPAPGALALLGLAGVIGSRRRRS